MDLLVEKFLQLFVDAFGFEWLTPKYHWLLHFGDHYRKFGMLLNCFVLERRHRIAKRYATDLRNTSKAANSSLIMEVTSHHLGLLMHSLHAFRYDIGLLDGRPPSKKVRKILTDMLDLSGDEEILVALHSRFSAFGICKKGDVVLIKDDSSYIAGQVLLHASVSGVSISMVDAWILKSSNLAAGIAKWSTADATRLLIETSDVLDTVIHTKVHACSVVTTLIPPEFR